MLQSNDLFKFEPDDVGLFFIAEQIYRDYQEFIKNAILPDLVEKYDIRLRELLALICIASAVEPVSAADLSEVMRQDPATLTRSNVILIGKNLITTTRHAEDKRTKIIHITEKGEALYSDFKTRLSNALGQFTHGADGNVDLLSHVENLAPARDRAWRLASDSAAAAL